MSTYYIGRLADDFNRSKSRSMGGWIVGHFAEGPRRSDKIEVKYWEF